MKSKAKSIGLASAVKIQRKIVTYQTGYAEKIASKPEL